MTGTVTLKLLFSQQVAISFWISTPKSPWRPSDIELKAYWNIVFWCFLILCNPINFSRHLWLTAVIYFLLNFISCPAKINNWREIAIRARRGRQWLRLQRRALHEASKPPEFLELKQNDPHRWTSLYIRTHTHIYIYIQYIYDYLCMCMYAFIGLSISKSVPNANNSRSHPFQKDIKKKPFAGFNRNMFFFFF